MSGFRKNFACEHELTNFIESAKRAVDDQTYVGSVMTDLSRAFDCLPPKLLLSKFHAYGVAEGWGGSRGGGGSRGPRTPPGPQRGGPGPLFQNEENSIYYLQFYLIPPNKSL